MIVFIFAILATLCEHVGRPLEEVRDRPPYYVLEKRNSSVLIADETRKNGIAGAVTARPPDSGGRGANILTDLAKRRADH